MVPNVSICTDEKTLKSGDNIIIAIAETLTTFIVHVSCDLEIGVRGSRLKGATTGVCHRLVQSNPTLVSKVHDVINFGVTRFPDSPMFLFKDFNLPNIT